MYYGSVLCIRIETFGLVLIASPAVPPPLAAGCSRLRVVCLPPTAGNASVPGEDYREAPVLYFCFVLYFAEYLPLLIADNRLRIIVLRNADR